MLEKIFLQILNMSFAASFVIVAVIVARLLLKKAPRVISYALWAVVLFRLVCPFSFESAISLLPVNANPIPQEIVYQQTPRINTGIPILNDRVNAVLPAPTLGDSMNPLQGWVAIGTFLWLCGIAALMIYSVISLLILKRKLRGAICEDGNVYLTEGLASPFVMGLFRPQIHLPTNLTDDEKGYILLHEQTHIKRLDHVAKIASFAVLCLHWFNPLVWIAFFLCGKDMEMSCDEAVIKRLGNEVKKDYSSSLLTLATGRRIVGSSPLAFGEGDTKSRIKNVLNYKKPAFWVVAVAVIAVVAIGIGLMANPKEPLPEVNTIYSTKLTEAQKAEITTRYQLDIGSNIFETKFHVSDNIKSYAYYVELYKHGTYLGTYVQNYGNFNARDGSIVTAFSMNRGESHRWESMSWTASMIDGGFASHTAIPFPNGFIPQGVSTSTLTNEGNVKEMPRIVPEQPTIIASIAMNSAELSELRAYDCTYLMEYPDKIAEYECVFIVKCVFSEKDETELASGAFSPPSTYLTTFELYNNNGGILQSSFSLATQTATELPALLLKGTYKTLPSVNDTPQDTEEYLKITIGELPDRVFFVYESKGKYWVEHPYDYIQELDESTYAALMEYLQADSGTIPGAPIVNSYYAGQGSRAFKMLQKSVFQNWVEYDNSGALNLNLINPKWDFDSFTQYYILDQNMDSTSDQELYYCTFSDENNKCGYVVVSYNGDSLSKIDRVETPYLYDLQANIDDITAKLGETRLDLSTAVAMRVRVADAGQNTTREAIRITDGNANQYLYYFDEAANNQY